MKICTLCLETKPIDAFPKKYKEGSKRASRCFICQRKLVKEHYLANKSYYIDKARKNREAYLDSVNDKLQKYLRNHPCIDCGESDVVVLEFDHLNDKIMNISNMLANGHPWSKIQNEIAKCEVVCCNCHRRRTASRGNWRRANWPS